MAGNKPDGTVSKALVAPRIARLLAVSSVVFVLCSSITRADNGGLALLHKMQAALGGADKIAAIHDLDWTVSAETFDHNASVK